jgi:hypothetical protein
MNKYFNLQGIVNYDIFTNKNYVLFAYNAPFIGNAIYHFCGAGNPAKTKLEMMNTYINKNLNSNSNIKIFSDRNQMLKYYSNSSSAILEIGIFKGDFFKFIEKECNPAKLDGVDIFSGTCISGDQDGNNVVTANLNLEYLKLLEQYKDNSKCKLYKNHSTKFLNSVDDETYDIIYIDGDHSYEGVKNDLELSFKKIKNGGYIMGHDYEMNNEKTQFKYEFGVKRAVTEFCCNFNQSLCAKAMDGCVGFCINVKK